MQVPSEKELLKRIKGFYTSRRHVKITRDDDKKKKKRKLSLKASRLTYVSYIIIWLLSILQI